MLDDNLQSMLCNIQWTVWDLEGGRTGGGVGRRQHSAKGHQHGPHMLLQGRSTVFWEKELNGERVDKGLG